MNKPASIPADLFAVFQACQIAGLQSSGARLLRRHANAVYLLPDANIVARVGDSRPATVEKASRGVMITRWLAELGFPAVKPIDIKQPIVLDTAVVTFWRYYPQDDRGYPPASHLGRLLRQLHQAGNPPVSLPDYRPLAHFRNVLDTATGLIDRDLTFLEDRHRALIAAFDEMAFLLPGGLIHGDAAASNTLWDGDRVVLSDWDAVCTGPREQDLALTHQNARIGLPHIDREAFAQSYGFDVTKWVGYPILRDIQELHTLTSLIRIAPHDQAVADQLHLRITCLRHKDFTTRWTAF